MTIEVCSFVTRVKLEAETSQKPGLMPPFDEIVTGPVDSVHIERMDGGLYWMVICKGDECQRIVIGSTSGRAHVVARTEID